MAKQIDPNFRRCSRGKNCVDPDGPLLEIGKFNHHSRRCRLCEKDYRERKKKGLVASPLAKTVFPKDKRELTDEELLATDNMKLTRAQLLRKLELMGEKFEPRVHRSKDND